MNLHWLRLTLGVTLACALGAAVAQTRAQAQTEAAPTATDAAEKTAEPPPEAPAPATTITAPTVGDDLNKDTFKLADAPKPPDMLSQMGGKGKDGFTLQVNGGAMAVTGNARSVAINAGIAATWRQDKNQVTGDAQYVYAKSAVRTENPDGTPNIGPMQKNAENFNSQLRYDRYLSSKDAIYVGNRFRIDHFAGLDYRIQGQTGYMRDVYNENAQRFWGEVGYDFTYDEFYGLPGDRTIHSARLFAGYSNKMNEHVNLVTGLESLFDIADPGHVRLNGLAQLNSKIAKQLQIGVQFVLRYDNVPPPTAITNLDTATSVNLLYSFL
jgi:putative salt-induced outer membrane protein YdiY